VSRTALRGLSTVGLAALILLVVPRISSAQDAPTATPVMDGATVRIDAVDPGAATASVGVTYRLVGDASSAPVGVRVLPVEGRSVSVLAAGATRRRVGLASDSTGMVRGALPMGPDDPSALGSDPLTLRYGVAGAWVVDGDRFDLLLPLVTLELPSAEARPGLVDVTLRLPAGARILESFPSSLAPQEGQGMIRLTGQLSVMPALVRVRGRFGGSGFGGVRTAETAVLLLIVGLGVLGWRYLTRTV
jgi:hypothetical protein